MATTKKIGEILLDNKFVTKQILDEALEHQRKFGGGLTQYLISQRYIDEEKLATCLCQQFRFPYLLISVYDIPESVIGIVPVHLAKKYWLMPVDKVENILTLVMSNPTDAEAIEEVKKATGCKIQPFVGIMSDIIKAIEHYYKVDLKGEKEDTEKSRAHPSFITKKDFKVSERRAAPRYSCKIDMRFPKDEAYRKAKIKNVSMSGFLFETDSIIQVGSYVVLEIDLPKLYSQYPIAAVVRVVRIAPLRNGNFDIGVQLIKIPKEDIRAIIAYSQQSGR